MFTKDTGSDKRIDGQDIREVSNPNKVIDAEEREKTEGGEMEIPEQGSAAQPASRSQEQEGEKDKSKQSFDSTDGKQSPATEAKVYTQSQYDAAIKARDAACQEQIERYKNQAAYNKKEADDYKDRHTKSCDSARHRNSLLAQAYAQLDERDIKVFQLITKYVQAQLDNEGKVELEGKLRDAERALRQASSDYATLSGKYCDLEKKYRELSAVEEQLKAEVERKDAELVPIRNELEQWQGIGGSMKSAMVPQCLADNQWFQEFSTELQDGILADQPSDPAMLVLASLAELAVMERTSVGPCFEWKKQLTDIGLVVANYMHSKKSAEGDVLKMLHDFAQAFQEMPILKKLKIGIRIPSLGGDFKTDEVKHKNNGSVVAKVLNWCIVEDGHVYCKAIVE